MLPPSQEFASRALHLLDHFVELLAYGAKPEMRHAAVADGSSGCGLTQRYKVVATARADENHVGAFTKAEFQSKGVEIEFLDPLRLEPRFERGPAFGDEIIS